MLVYPKLRRTGLCNKLFPWARAVVYAYDNNARIISPKWTDFMRIGPWIRREQDKRYYFNEILNVGYVSRFCGILSNPIVLRLLGAHIEFGMKDFFLPFLNRQAIVKAELLKIVHPKLRKVSENIAHEDYIGVHIRRGDFAENGLCIADDWYRRAIVQAKSLVGELPIKVFSDEKGGVLNEILDGIKGVEIMPKAPAVQDLLSLSSAKVLVCTSNSTFSMWAVFLGQMPSIWSDVATPPKMYNGVDRTIILN